MTKGIVVFGAGLVGVRHVEAVAAQARLLAIVDPASVAADLAAKMGVPYYSTGEACLAEVAPDGIIIATPNHLHADHAELALSHGIPALIEKPVADTLENADRIVAASARADVPVLIGHHRRHNPIIRRAKELIAGGAIGDVVAVTGQFWLYKPDDYFAAAWRKQPGAGPLLINLIHDIDLMRHLCGEVTSLTALRSNDQRGGPVEDSAALLMRFSNGALGTFSLSDTIAAPWSWEMTAAENPVYPHIATDCYRIGGTHGSLSIPDLTLWTHTRARSWWEEITPTPQPPEPGDAWMAQLAHFLDVIDGAEPLVPATEGRASLALVAQAETAALPV